MNPSLDAILRTVLVELKSRLAQLYRERLVQLILYGSQARGEATVDSDIDVLVVLRDPVNPGEEICRASAIVASLSLKYDRVISCQCMEESRFKTRHGSLLRNVRKEGISL